MKTFDYAGKTWEYDNNTIFAVEIGRYQNMYKQHKRTSELLNTDEDSVKFITSIYENFNVSDGYKKRLVMINNNERTVIAHQTTKRNIK